MYACVCMRACMMGMWESRAVVCVYVCVHHGHTCWQRQQCPRWCVSHCHSGSFESWTQTFPPGAPSFDCLSHCHCDGRVSSRRRGGREYLEWSGVERWSLEHNSPKSFFLSFIVVRLLARLLRVVREFLCCFNLTLKSGLNFRIGGQPPETERPNKKKKRNDWPIVHFFSLLSSSLLPTHAHTPPHTVQACLRGTASA